MLQNTTTSGFPAQVDTAALLADPYATYATLRAAGPVHRITGPDGLPAWLVTRHDDVRTALADPRLSLDKRNAQPGNYSGLPLPPALDANLLNMDPPNHTRIRRLVTKAFTPGRVDKLREPVRVLCEELLDVVEPHGRADLIAAYSGLLPVAVICDLLGVPAADRRDFRAWTDALITPDTQRPELAKEAVGSMLRFYTSLIASKRANPADDLLSDLIAVRDDASAGDHDTQDVDTKQDRLTENELTSLAFLILFGGYENVVHLIGNSVLALLQRPELLAELRRNPAAIPAAVEEFARWDGPAPLAIRRFPLEDVEIGGVTIPTGETVLLSIASANRDPDRFPDPDRLDPQRAQSGNLWLGHGIHYCLGAALARVEAETAIEVLLRRFPGLALAVPPGELQWRPSVRARGLTSLPVTW